MNIVALQINIEWEDQAANFENVRRLLAQAAPEKGSLVVLPEMFATGFSMNDIAEPIGGKISRFLADTAKAYQACLVAGVAVRGPDGLARNMALAHSPGGELLACYSKMKPFTLGHEAKHYVAGDQPKVFAWQNAKVAPFICYDLRFPEIFRMAVATHRPHFFTVMANWPQKRIHHWVRLLQARAIENQAFVVGVNRCGNDPEHAYNGRSIMVDYHGEIMADAGEHEGWINSRLDLAALEKYRADLPFLEDMPDGIRANRANVV